MFKSPSVRRLWYTYEVLLVAFIVSMSCLRSGLLA